MFSHAVVCASSGAGDVELLASVACDLVDGVSAQAKLCVCDCSIGAFTFRFALFFFFFFLVSLSVGSMGYSKADVFFSEDFCDFHMSNPPEIHGILKYR